jgi:hypothetical protein
MDTSRSLPSTDPACHVCSKPIRSGSFVVYEHGELSHVFCRSRTYQLTSLEAVHRAKTAQKRASQVAEDATRLQSVAHSLRARRDACPLCGQRTTLTDWQQLGWVAVEGCSCMGFFMATSLLDRVRALTADERADIAARIRKFRSMTHEAWLCSTDGTVTGSLVVRTARPDSPTAPRARPI